MIKQFLLPICNVVPIITKADQYSKKEIKELRKNFKSNAEKIGTNFFNCAGATGIEELEYPFAIINPTDIKDGVAIREIFDG
jgi:septin family protein